MTFHTNVPHFESDEGDKLLFPFGPPIFQTEVDKNFIKDLIKEGRALNIKDNDWNEQLAGNLKYGRSFHYKKDYVEKAEPYLKTYVERFFNAMIKRFGSGMIEKLLEVQVDVGKMKQGELRLDSLWINFSKKHDHNPPHTHKGVLSFVIFCKIPEKIFSVQADSNTKRAGELSFIYGEQMSHLMGCEYPVKPYETLMFIFPNDLKHYVGPFWIDEERISVSGNFVVV